MKDHEIRETVNRVRDIALEYRDTQQLRSRIAGELVPLLSSSLESTGYVAPVTRAEYEELKKQVENLSDEFKNSIKYNKKKNLYYLVWTEKQINDARIEAEELMKKLNWVDCQQAT